MAIIRWEPRHELEAMERRMRRMLVFRSAR